MTVDAITLNSQYNDYKKQNASVSTEETSIFLPDSTNPLASSDGTSVVLRIEDFDTNEEKISSLKLQYQQAIDEQGFIGDIVDGFKNLFQTQNSSNKI